MKTKPFLLVFVFVILCFMLNGCNNTNTNLYKTFILNEGTVHFSLEYRTYYKIKEVMPGASSGDVLKDLMVLTLIGPLAKGTKDHTLINVIVDKPDELVPDAKTGIERAEKMAAKWNDYKLLNKYELAIDGVQAYRIDYQNRNIVPAIAETSNQHFISVYREVRFDANGYVWMIQMESDSSTAETDAIDFDHIIETFKILN
jgi:hypothetical protein